MHDSLDNAVQELKRVDHLIYVSLKYTRTVDMLKHAIVRMITALDFMLDALLLYAKSKKKIIELPPSPGLKMNATKEIFDDDKIQDIVVFYALLRKLDRADFTRAREFRRHVTMTAAVDGEEREVNIDVIHEYYDKVKEIFQYVKSFIDEEKKI